MQKDFNAAVALHRQGHLDAARQAYLAILEHHPEHAQALHLLGVLNRQEGRYEDAVALITRAIRINPDIATFHSNLGNALRDSGSISAAEAAFRQAINLDPKLADAHNNLGVLLLRSRRGKESLEYFIAAIALNPQHTEAHNNLGFALKDLGQLDEAFNCYQTVLGLHPRHQDALYNLGNIALYRNDLDGALAHFSAAEQQLPSSLTGLSCAVRQGLLHYLRDEHALARIALVRAQSQLSMMLPAAMPSRIYCEYLQSLLDGGGGQPGTHTPAVLHVIGESHMLSAQGVIVELDGVQHRCQGWWIEGCKQWHLGNDQRNRFKVQFENVLAALPPASIVLLTMGEIDCRHNEGILSAWKKTQEASMDRLIETTVRSFVRYVTPQALLHGHRLIISGVPASNQPLENIPVADQPLLVEVIREFNARLEKAAMDAGHRFVDVYRMTVAEDGWSNRRWHIDAHHLGPAGWMEAVRGLVLRPGALH
jgi:tetratricopeptide (TPR) repeat protein